MSSSTPAPPTSRTPAFRMEPFGEAAVIALLGGVIDEANYRQLARLSRAIQENPPRGFTELVPAYNSILVVFDPLLSDTTAVSSALQTLASTLDPMAAEATKDIIELPVAYGGDHGPDLESVAAHAGLSTEEVIAIHSSRPYLVYMLGFTPGFPYLGGMDPRIAAPRLKTPRTRVPAGSVGIADTQTGVYPLESPGGWNLIGRTPLRLFDPGRQFPVLLSPGKYVHFVPISQDSFDALHSSREDRSMDDRSMDDQEPGAGSVMVLAENGGGRASRNIVVLKPGALSTVQDAGRFGYQAAGVPPSGPMDEYSMNLANILAGNEPGTACIECTLGGLELRFEADSIFALAG
ncbi:MAG: 5-oxoprolinase subunit PxpB, partial [Spirochaetota bacterium]